MIVRLEPLIENLRGSLWLLPPESVIAAISAGAWFQHDRVDSGESILSPAEAIADTRIKGALPPDAPGRLRGGGVSAQGGAMPKTSNSGEPKQSELPDTLKRSSKKAQRQFAKTHDSAAEQYGEGERAHRTAYASLKHNFEKVGDHWEPKDEAGPSDPRSKKTTAQKRRGQGETFGGLDYEGNTKAELYERAKSLDIKGRSTMSKRELARAIAKKQ